MEREITETQSAQIELDKTAEEFRKHHEERHGLYLQCQEVLENIGRRDKAIKNEGENYAEIKKEINSNREALEARKVYLQKEKNTNKNLELKIISYERQIIEERSLNKKIKENIENLEAEVEILKNQLSAFSTDLSNKKARCGQLSQELLVKKQRLNNAQKKYQAQELKLKNEDYLANEFSKNKESAEERYKINEKEKIVLEKEIRAQKDELFKCIQQLFKLRETEADLYGEIQGTMAACRNLQSHINKLNQEFQRQQELLYNAEYQIQLMERRVALAQGEKTLEEKKDLEDEIKTLEFTLKNVNGDYKLLSNSLNKIDDDLRAVNRKVKFF